MRGHGTGVVWGSATCAGRLANGGRRLHRRRVRARRVAPT
jgi:hypothetical protein